MGLIDLLFPVSCLECHKPADEESSYICKKCLSKVQVLNQFDPVSKIFSIFRYEGVIRKGIIKIKYNFAYDIAEELADISIKNFKNPFGTNVVLLPIPLHKSRENWRGFNQSEIIGKLIAEKLGWKFEKDILIRPKASLPQVGLKGIERVRNIRGKFAVNPRRITLSEVEGEPANYILFDDVLTTGSTIKEAIKVLKKVADPERSRRIFGLTITK